MLVFSFWLLRFATWLGEKERELHISMVVNGNRRKFYFFGFNDGIEPGIVDGSVKPTGFMVDNSFLSLFYKVDV